MTRSPTTPAGRRKHSKGAKVTTCRENLQYKEKGTQDKCSQQYGILHKLNITWGTWTTGNRKTEVK